MKRIITFTILIILMFMVGNVYAIDTFDFQFQVSNNKENEDFDLYILLPEKYVIYAINQSNLEINYEGVETLKQYSIPGIDVEIDNIQDEIYEEKGVKYIQILLEKNSKDIYEFSILENYPNMDMKYRIKNSDKDYIMHIDNFKVKDGKCEIEYNYEKDEIKQPDKLVIPPGVIVLMILLAVIVIVGGISYIKQKN